MPPLVLPEGLPPDLVWYLFWISFHGLLIFVFRLLSAPHNNAKEKVEEATIGRLFSLNSYLWDVLMNLGDNPYDGPLKSVDDLSKLLFQTRKANKPMSNYNNLQKHTALGKLASIVGIIIALVLGGVHYYEFPLIIIVNQISIIFFIVISVWNLWHIINSSKYYYLTLKISNEEE